MTNEVSHIIKRGEGITAESHGIAKKKKAFKGGLAISASPLELLTFYAIFSGFLNCKYLALLLKMNKH